MTAGRRDKIAVVIPRYGLVGGGELFAFELTERLAEDPRYDIHVLANQWQAGSARITFHKIPILTFPKWLTTVSFAWFVAKKLKALKPDIVHTHDRIFRADLATVHSIPHMTWVGEIRRKRIPSLFDLATGWVEGRMFEKGGCRKIMPVSTLAAEKLCGAFPSICNKIAVIPPGVDLERFGQARPDWRHEIRQEFGIGPDDFLVLFVGMNFELKGLAPLARAVAIVQQQEPTRKISLLVVGKGDSQKFRHLAQELGVGEQVVFVGVRRDMERIYQAADTFCLLSQFDTFGMVVLEAMAAGVPVVVSDRVGAKDLVEHGRNGFVVEREDVATIAGYLALLAIPDKHQKCSEAAIRLAREHSWEKVAEQYGLLYRTLPG